MWDRGDGVWDGVVRADGDSRGRHVRVERKKNCAHVQEARIAACAVGVAPCSWEGATAATTTTGGGQGGGGGNGKKKMRYSDLIAPNRIVQNLDFSQIYNSNLNI